MIVIFYKNILSYFARLVLWSSIVLIICWVLSREFWYMENQMHNCMLIFMVCIQQRHASVPVLPHHILNEPVVSSLWWITEFLKEYHIVSSYFWIFPRWLIKCPVFIAKCYRLCGFNNRREFLTILNVHDEGARTLLSQEGLSTWHCSAGYDAERRDWRKEQHEQSHKIRSPHTLLVCLALEIWSIACSLLANHSSVPSYVTKWQLWHHHHPHTGRLQPQRRFGLFDSKRLSWRFLTLYLLSVTSHSLVPQRLLLHSTETLGHKPWWRARHHPPVHRGARADMPLVWALAP